MRVTKTITLLLLAASVAACSDMNNTGGMSASATPQFIKEASSGDMFEVQSGRLVLSKSHNKATRQVAQRLITDHTQSTNELKNVLANQGIQVPPPQLTEDQQENINKMKNARHMDKVFLDIEKEDHEEDIEKFQDYMNNGDNPAIRNFASQQLPILRQHLALVEQAQEAHENHKRKKSDQ